MTRATLRIAVVLCGLAQTSSNSVAQVVFPRPRWRDGVDTNDAAPYISRARTLLYNGSDSASAAAKAALYWAGRLDPTSSDVPYLLAVAVFRPIIVKAREGRVSGKVLRRELTPARLRYVDSLMREAWLREPFVNIDLEPMLCLNLVPPDRVRDPATRGYFAYQFQEYGLALDSWAKALARDSSRLDLRFHRAHTFFRAEAYDSTVGELQAALAIVVQPDSEIAPIVSPTYVLNYALGVALERLGRVDSAKAAYRRALTENLGLYMAHVRLSNLLLLEGDTVQALMEVALAAGIAPQNPMVATYYTYQLLQARRFTEAAEQVRAAIALDSLFATPYLLRGVAEQAVGRDSVALANFDIFLQRAAQSDSRREWAKQRIDALQAKPDD